MNWSIANVGFLVLVLLREDSLENVDILLPKAKEKLLKLEKLKLKMDIEALNI